MGIKLIVADMGGTFLSDQETYNRERFMVQYQQMKVQGIRFVAASGNQYYQLVSFFPEITNEAAFVAGNSDWVVSGSKDVFNGELSKDASTIVVEYLLTRSEVEIIACGENSAYIFKKYDGAMKTAAKMYYRRLKYVDNFDNLEDISFKFGLNLSDELTSQVQKVLHEAIGDIMVPVYTGNGGVDLAIPGVHKASGLHQLQKLWGIDDSEVAVFGDGGSDTEMLRQAGPSLVMENADSAVVAVAKYRAGSNNREDALDVIDKVLKHEAPFNQ